MTASDLPALATDTARQALLDAGYCPHCGRGDCAPTADEYEQMRRQAERMERLAGRFQARLDAGREWARRNLTPDQQTGLLRALRGDTTT